MTPAISIIIACYNSDGMLNDALTSLQQQSLSNIEIIVINDNPDDIADEKIILEKKKLDSRIKYKKNSVNLGTGMSRQIGVELARGEFIGFLDVDDYALPITYEILYNLATQHMASIAIGNWQTFASRDIDTIKIKKSDNFYRVIDGRKLYELQLNRVQMPYYLRVDWWNKIYKKSLFSDYKIKFPKVVRHEGFMSTTMSLLAEKVVIVDRILFLTYTSSNSVSKKFKINNIIDMIASTKHCMEWLKKLNYLHRYYTEFINFSFFVIFNINLKHILKLENNKPYLKYLEQSLLDKDIFPHFNTYLMQNKRTVEFNLFLNIMGDTYKNMEKIYDTDYFYRTDLFKKIPSSTHKPIVTIITITKNIIKQGRMDTILEAIESIQKQTYGSSNIEHIIIDGASTDGSVDFFIQQLEYGKITRVVSEKDDGIYNAMNKGLLYASGDFILFLNSDDKLNEHCLQTLVELCLSEKTDYAFCDATIINQEGKAIGSHIGDMNKIYFGTPYCHQGLLCRKECYINIKYNENYKLTMWPFAFDLYNSGFKFSYVNKKLAYFRSDGLSASPLFAMEQTTIKEKIAGKLNITIDEYEQINKFIRRKNIQITLEQLISLIKKIYIENTDISKDFYEKMYNLLQKNTKFNPAYTTVLRRIPTPQNSVKSSS